MENEELCSAQLIGDMLDEKRFVEVRSIVVDFNPADIAALFDDLSETHTLMLFRLLPKELAAETFAELEGDTQERLIRSFSDNELREVIDEMYLDDTVDLIEEMPASVVKRILRNTDSETRAVINELLHYPEDSAGSIMTIEYVDLKAGMTVDDAFTRIRRTGVDKETIYTCYVTGNDRKLLGTVSVKSLLLSPTDCLISDIMETNVISVRTNDDKEFVAHQFEKYDFLAMPVVDNESRLVGIVTVDDALDVLQDENTEDIEKMAAIMPSDKSYLRTGVFETWKNRIPWLLLLMVSATFTGQIITSFENSLASMVILTAYVPMIMDTCGNAGGQASVTIIRSLSLGDIQMRDIGRIMWKESRVSILCGVTLAAANFIKMLLIDRLLLGNTDVSVMVSLAVCLTLVSAVFFAKLIGCTLPIAAKRIGFDPAVMASPFITTIVDAIALVVYFNIATMLLGI